MIQSAAVGADFIWRKDGILLSALPLCNARYTMYNICKGRLSDNWRSRRGLSSHKGFLWVKAIHSWHSASS